MIARVAQFEGINIEAAQATMEEAEGIIHPLIQALSGYQGVMELASADGKFISIALFDTEENAAAAESVFDEELPAKLGHIFQQWEGTRTSVGHYMVVGDERA
jgi:hypothetical protein